ncbi:enoyl-CoA hydratase/isomerase family protein [Bordetella sp. 02P26C-1]|uniref:enoyl-CoA hydratase/isomerase family protein n=1 Tax=Bordetella sp. 02P26C-1 TaxID=2683195 RepID=UPI0013548BCD|nr:enoyl-CoA hydratase/isomerase family protein [Bordetella sp. 02P26C-1]MVW77830.1 enoyl-CoA hydratase/isomerase family protein [Bordetella sp. 02P26C-1]
MSDTLRIEKTAVAWTFTLNRSEKRNALCAELVEALIAGVEAAHVQQVPLLVFRGAGKNLSAGFDFTDYETQSEGDLLLRMVRIETLLQMVASSPSLTLALAHGRNFGAGVDLFAACKLRHCSADATFRMPGLKFGLVLGSRRFRTLVGTAKAISILGEARTFGADEAREIGFVLQVSPENDWPALTQQAAQTATTLEPDVRVSLYSTLEFNNHDADMAALVRSAARPGIKDRIAQYLSA